MLKPTNSMKPNKNEAKKQRSQQPKAQRNRKNNSPSPVVVRKQISINKQNHNPNKYPPQTEQDNPYRQSYYRQKLQKQQKQHLTGQPISPSSYGMVKHVPVEIQIKINSKSLQKCQIHPQFQPSPKALFLMNHPQKDDILCCESCGWGYGNKKISLEKLTNTIISPGLTIKDYYLKLQEKIDSLQIAKSNLIEYAKQFRSMSSLQSQKLTKYYNDILEIIEVCMRESENILMKYVNDGERIFTEKRDEIEAELEITKKQLTKLFTFQQKQLHFHFGTHKNNLFNVEAGLRKYQLDLSIPIFHSYTQVPEIIPNFSNLFKKFYSIEQLTQQELNVGLKQRQYQYQQSNKSDHYLNYQTASQSYQRSSARQEDDADLFCDESLGESKTNKTHDFSFEKSNEGESQLGRNNDCILELVEEEDVISPVFKAI